jgi:hypothetical protein
VPAESRAAALAATSKFGKFGFDACLLIERPRGQIALIDCTARNKGLAPDFFS